MYLYRVSGFSVKSEFCQELRLCQAASFLTIDIDDNKTEQVCILVALVWHFLQGALLFLILFPIVNFSSRLLQ